MENNQIKTAVTINWESLDLLQASLGGRNDETFGEALSRYMDEQKISVAALEELSHINRSALRFYKKGERLPKIGHVVAICVAMKLHIKRSLHLVSLANFCFGSSDADLMYLSFLSACWCSDLTVEQCNKVLISRKMDTLV